MKKFSKVFILLCLTLSLSACGTAKEKKLDCTLGGTQIVLTFKDGQIINYYVEGQGDMDKDAVDNLNGIYLDGVTKDDDAIAKMKTVMTNQNGTCK